MTSPIVLPITLRACRAADALAPPAAWLIPGQKARTWLDELVGWRVPVKEIRLLVLPRSRNDRRASGALAIVPNGQAARIKPSPLAAPYVAMGGGRLYHPAGWRVYPPMSDTELKAHLTLDVHILHPSLGLVGCASEELLRVADLIEMRPQIAVDWGKASAGVTVDARIRSVKPADVPGFDDVMRSSRQDIGRDDPSELPPVPGESTLRKLGMNGALGALGAMKWLSSLAAGGGKAGGAAGWLGGVQRWTAEQMDALRNALEQGRNREIARLMRLLQSDPDEGLRYALPVGGTGSSRGTAPPSGKLGRRNVNFDLRGLFSASPADSWTVSWEAQQALLAKYRELASRELSLGRYRRAAYIFARLLNDLHAAANALKQGRFFREAAVLYREKLQDRAAAARCLEEAGLLTEAIEVYESLRAFEKVGDLYRAIGRDDLAESSYRKAVEVLVAGNDRLAAARVLETKLDQVDEALAMLDGAWPDSMQPEACVEEAFRLLGRTARHEEAARRAARLTPDYVARALPVANILANVATSYPSVEVREIAADAARVVVGTRLPSADRTEAGSLVDAIVRISVSDQLLARDGRRYLEQLERARQKLKAPDGGREKLVSKGAAAPPRLVRTFRLGTGIRGVTAQGSMFYALSTQDDTMQVVSGRWDGQMHSTKWVVRGAAEADFRVQFIPNVGLCILPCNTAMRVPVAVLHQRSPDAHVMLGTPAFFPPGALYDVDVDESGVIWLLHGSDHEPNLILSEYNSAGSLRASHALPLEKPGGQIVRTLRLVVRTGNPSVSVGSRIYSRIAGNWNGLELRKPIVEMFGSPLHTRRRLIVSFEEGGCIAWPESMEVRTFHQELLDVNACLLRDGTLVAVARGRLSAYRISGLDLIGLYQFEVPETPLAVLQTHEASEAAVFCADGGVRVYRFLSLQTLA